MASFLALDKWRKKAFMNIDNEECRRKALVQHSLRWLTERLYKDVVSFRQKTTKGQMLANFNSFLASRQMELRAILIKPSC
jgi:hypothetical protein